MLQRWPGPEDRGHRPALPARYLLALLGPYDQTPFRVQAIDAFGVHLPALAAQQHRQSPIAVAHVGGGQFFQLPAQRQLRILPAAIALARAHHPSAASLPDAR